MDTEVLNRVICFTLADIHLWSGRKKLHATDLKIRDGELPPADLASLGSKKICDPEDLSVFEKIKRRAHRACEKVGVRFLGGYAVPEDKADELAKELDLCHADFYKEKHAFITAYDQRIQDWITVHPGWETSIQSAITPVREVDRQIAFAWHAFRVTEAVQDADDAQSALNSGLCKTIGGLSSQLFSEIAKMADEVLEKTLMGRESVTQRALSPIRTIRGKLAGLAFLDKRVRPIIDIIDHVMQDLPDAGKIEGMELSALYGLVSRLSSVERMQLEGDMILNGATVEDVLEGDKSKQPDLATVEQTEGEAVAEPEDVEVEAVETKEVEEEILPSLPMTPQIPTTRPMFVNF
jgi:hypothetical protein